MAGSKLATPQGLAGPARPRGLFPSLPPILGGLRPQLPSLPVPGPLQGPDTVSEPDPYEKTRTRGNEVFLVFDPDRSAKVDRCDRIVFAQTCQILVDGVAVQPGSFLPEWKYRDAWALPSGVFLDVTDEEPGPYYPHVFGGWKKDSSSEPASMGDAPHVERESVFFDARRFPKGAKLVVFRLETFAACVRGRDIGSFYEGVRWDWTKSAGEQLSGKAGTATIRDRNAQTPTLEFLAAIARYLAVQATAPGR
jgi:hypothetical protein